MVDDPPSTKWTTSTRAKLPRGLPFSYRNELHRGPARVWLGKRREYVHRACTSSLCARPPPTCVCVRERDRYKPRHNAPSIPMPPPSPTTSHHHAPLLLTLSLIFPPPFLYTRGHYQNYNLQIYKATNTNRCNFNGVCLVVLAKEDINYPLHACGTLYKKCILMFRAMHGHLVSP